MEASLLVTAALLGGGDGVASGAMHCDRSRPAVWHHAGGKPARRPAGLGALIPCASPTSHQAIEPTIGVSRNDAVFVDGTVDASDPRFTPLVLRSLDHGATWRDVSPTIAGQHRNTQDPYLWLDERTGRLFSADVAVTAGGAYLSFSDNRGAAWTTTVAGADLTDHETVFGGPPSTTRPRGYPNVVYYCASFEGAEAPATFGVACDRSLDGGVTWSPAGEPAFTNEAGNTSTGEFGIPGACNTLSGHGSVGPDGTVYVPAGWCGQPWLAISKDEGMTWRRVQVARNGMPYTSHGVREHEAGVGADARGNLYYTWVAHDRLPYLAVSHDGGRSWGHPMMIAAPSVREASLPGIDVRPDGAVAVDYMGSANSPGPPYDQPDTCVDAARCAEEGEYFLTGVVPARYARARWNAYLTVTRTGSASRPVFASQSLNNPKDPLIRGNCGPIRCREAYDFLDVEFGPDGSVWTPYVDGCVGKCVHTPASGGHSPDNAHQGWVGRLAPARLVEPKLHLRVRPRRGPACRPVRFRFVVTATRPPAMHGDPKPEPVAGAKIRFDGRRLRTGKHGRATVVLTIRRPGRHRAIATKAGFLSASTSVDVVRLDPDHDRGCVLSEER